MKIDENTERQSQHLSVDTCDHLTLMKHRPLRCFPNWGWQADSASQFVRCVLIYLDVSLFSCTVCWSFCKYVKRQASYNCNLFQAQAWLLRVSEIAVRECGNGKYTHIYIYIYNNYIIYLKEKVSNLLQIWKLSCAVIIQLDSWYWNLVKWS